MRQLLRRRRSGRLGPALIAAATAASLASAGLMPDLTVVGSGFSRTVYAQDQAPAPAPLAIQITSPLGRTGISGSIRIVARVTSVDTTLSPIQFYVDGKLIGEDKNGAPYAIEWADENPYELREIAVAVQDSKGNVARDSVTLKPLEVSSSTSVQSVMLEPQVVDSKGRPVNGLRPTDFQVFEDGLPQTLDMAAPDTVPGTYTLLVDSSQSMNRRMDFVQEAARRLPDLIRANDTVVVAPFSRTLGAVTGPTKDRDTIAGAIDAITPAGGTAILDCLAEISSKLMNAEGRQTIVVITDGYDEHSAQKFEETLMAVKATNATVYVIGIGGVAGISLQGEELLKRIATETGGRAFFPSREEQFFDIHAMIAADVQVRYMVTYTPTNQKLDGTWRKITIKTPDPAHIVKARPGYYAPAPPPIRPSLELTIRDINKQFIDVSAEDLVVIEDGVEQKVEVFQEAATPVSIMLVLDQSGSMKKAAAKVVEAAKSFVNALPAKDKVALMLFADEPKIVEDFTVIRDWITKGIDKYQANGGTALYDALAESLQRLQKIEGRRAIVILTDGRDENNPGTAPGSAHTFTEVLRMIRDVGAMIFPIGMGTNLDRAYLERMAELSSGEALFPEDVSMLEANYRRVLENLRRRYVISYTSTNFSRNGGWRKVEVRSSRPGIVIESRGGYFAPSGSSSGSEYKK